MTGAEAEATAQLAGGPAESAPNEKETDGTRVNRGASTA